MMLPLTWQQNDLSWSLNVEGNVKNTTKKRVSKKKAPNEQIKLKLALK